MKIFDGFKLEQNNPLCLNMLRVHTRSENTDLNISQLNYVFINSDKLLS